MPPEGLFYLRPHCYANAMTMVMFDTLKFANHLKSAGVAPAHAEAEAQALAEVFDVVSRDIVTREYLDIRLDQLEAAMVTKEYLEVQLTQIEQRIARLEAAVVTKDYFSAQQTQLEKRIAGLEAVMVTKEYLAAQQTQLEQRMTIRLGTMMVVATGVVATLVKQL